MIERVRGGGREATVVGRVVEVGIHDGDLGGGGPMEEEGAGGSGNQGGLGGFESVGSRG